MELFRDPLQAVEELIKITISLSTERDLHRLLEMIVTSARKLTGAEAGRVYVLDRTKRYLCLEVEQNERVDVGAVRLPSVPLFGEHGPNTRNVCAYSAFSGRLVNISNVYRYAGFDFSDLYEYDQKFGYRTRSLVTVPLRSCELVTSGVLQLLNRRDESNGRVTQFGEKLAPLVEAFASQAAVAVDNVTLMGENRRLIEVLDTANRALERENQELRERVSGELERGAIIGESPAMRAVFDLMQKIVSSDVTVLVRGETGTGKELVAQAIHRNSRRRGRSFVAQNCAAVPEGLLESELFGYRKGAFTGAGTDKRGLFEQADGGTLFLDEIGDLSLELQAKLLRVLQEGEIRPLGGLEDRKVDVRVIAATHRDLDTLIAEGAFREDLYYRLMVFPIEVPPLRERKEDLPPLLDHFIARFSKRYEKRIKGIAPEAMRLLLDYDYPGNVRELQNQLERAVLLAEPDGCMLPEHLPQQIQRQSAGCEDPLLSPQGTNLREIVRRYEARVIGEHLRANDWNQTRTAELLGVPRRTLVEKIGRYHIVRPL